MPYSVGWSKAAADETGKDCYSKLINEVGKTKCYCLLSVVALRLHLVYHTNKGVGKKRMLALFTAIA